MSLVGSLEDLGLGDILQIVSLSRKSGLLLIRSDDGEGRIVFCDGLVCAAFVKGEPEDLRGLLVGGGFVPEDDFERARNQAAGHGVSLVEALLESTDLAPERLESLRREHVERSAFRMFTWRFGEFSFEVRDIVDERDLELLLSAGVNAQYLSMEAARLGDEVDESSGIGTTADSTDAGDDEPMFSGEISDFDEGPSELDHSSEFGDGAAGADLSRESVAGGGLAAVDALALATAERVGAEFDVDTGDAPSGDVAESLTGDARMLEAGEARSIELSEFPPPAPVAVSEPAPRKRGVSLVVIDADLDALEWVKGALGELFARVHIFQRAEAGIERIRQYLRRGELPTVLVSDRISGDVAGGNEGAAELIGRLRAQAPGMAILVVSELGRESPRIQGSDVGLCRPRSSTLSDRGGWEELGDDAEALREAVRPWLARSPTREGSRRTTSAAGGSAEELRKLREASERIRDPQMRGEVLSIVLEFAARTFPRVAMFMVRDDALVGMAQIGLPQAGGPDDSAFREIQVPLGDCAWLQGVVDSRTAVRGAPPGEQAPISMLGEPPQEAYAAPIESGGHVVALLYAAPEPARNAVGDTTILEIVLHEAGLALERALLQRALADSA